MVSAAFSLSPKKGPRVSRSKLEELSVFPLHSVSMPALSLRGSTRLLDELQGDACAGGGEGMPEFSPELRSKILDMVAGTCRKSRVH